MFRIIHILFDNITSFDIRQIEICPERDIKIFNQTFTKISLKRAVPNYPDKRSYIPYTAIRDTIRYDTILAIVTHAQIITSITYSETCYC